jgi:hypothetical protein
MAMEKEALPAALANARQGTCPMCICSAVEGRDIKASLLQSWRGFCHGSHPRSLPVPQTPFWSSWLVFSTPQMPSLSPGTLPIPVA